MAIKRLLPTRSIGLWCCGKTGWNGYFQIKYARLTLYLLLQHPRTDNITSLDSGLQNTPRLGQNITMASSKLSILPTTHMQKTPLTKLIRLFFEDFDLLYDGTNM
jgi:hypothetical protein